MKITLVFLFLLCTIATIGQDHLPRLRNFTPKDYGENQTPESWSITEDTNGIMYFGNSGGLLTYDRERWDFIPVRKGHYVLSIAVEKNSNLLFIGCSGGEFGYIELHRNGESQYISLSDSINSNAQPGKVWRTYNSNGSTFFQTESAIYRWIHSRKELTTIRSETSYHTMLQCGNDIYVRERKTGLKVWNGSEFTLVPGGEKFEIYGVFDILPYDADRRLIVTQEMGMLLLEKESIVALSMDSTDELRNKFIVGGLHTFDSVYYLNSLTHGVYEMDRTGEVTNVYSRESGLKSNDVKSIFMDSYENLWLATGNGISVINTAIPLDLYTGSVGLEGNIQCVKEYNGSLLVGTSVGLFQQIGGRHSFEKLDLEHQVWDLEVIHENLFIGTNNGLFVFDGFYLDAISSTNVEDLFFDDGNNMLFASGSAGVFIYDVINSYSEFQHNPKFLGGVTGTLKDSKTNSIWIGTTESGIVKFDFDGFEYGIEEFGFEQGVLENEWIKPVGIDENILFATASGLLVYENDSFQVYYDHPFPEFAEFNHFAQHDGTLWYCVNNQIGHVENDAITEEYPFKGIDLGRINFIYADSALWIGGSEGLMRYTFDPIRNRKEPRLLVRRVQFKDSVVYSGIGPIEIGVIPYELNDLKFTLAVVSSSIQNDIVYRYLNDDKKWTSWSNSPTIELHNLSHGKHELEIIGKDTFGVKTQKVSLSFYIDAPWFLTWWAFVIYLLALLILILISVHMGRMRLKKQNIRLEGIVAKRTQELENSYYQIKEQKEEITASINYARRIQEAILPRKEDIQNSLKEYFILYRPKDIVSGDFYWFAEVDGQQIFVCADCTGHGVPGAFMSMIGSDKLNRKVLEEGYTCPSEILRELNIGIKQSLKQSNDENSTRDGMDAGIIKLNGLKLSYSGANRPLWFVRDGILNEIKPTKAAIAGLTPNEQKYELHELDLVSGDTIYLTTDGYPDQFGGDNGKKLKTKQLKRILVDIQSLKMSEQKEVLNQKFMDWMGNLEQLDDVCIVGIRIQ